MDTQALTEFVRSELVAIANPDKAGPMAAYMKTDMPFHGVQKAGRTPILRQLKRQFVPINRAEYEQAVLALWAMSHREEKYLAIDYARAFKEFVVVGSMPLYRQMIVDGAWWDLVDGVAGWLVGGAMSAERHECEPIVREWIGDPDMWLRRTSIICQLGHKADTDTVLLDDACSSNVAETEFFIRKAIGWALREYAKTDPDWVRAYVEVHKEELSGLSYREATKHL
jgi:3-methyladenine DNA glycosylase AlkD